MKRPEDPRTPPLPGFEPVIHIPVVRIPQPDGSLLIRAGKPEVLKGGDEITCAEFARATGLSHRHVLTLIEQGQIAARPLSPLKASRKRIPRSELARYLQLQNQ